jgi:hypothetical protein
VVSIRRVWGVSLVALILAAVAITSAETNQKTFEKEWVGRQVVVKQPLYSLVYNEQGVVGAVKAGRRSGLTVVTPFAGTHFQFDGRRHVDDVVEHDVSRIPAAVTVAYRKDRTLGEGFVQQIEPVTLTYYDVGFQLMVKAARVERDTVQLTLVQPGDPEEIATSLTVKWPVPLSKSFSERGNVEELIQRYLTVRE